MQKSVEARGKTVEAAVASALHTLNLKAEEVTVEVLEEPLKKGFLGLGSHGAKVKVTKKFSPESCAIDFMEGFLKTLDLDGIVGAKRDNDILTVRAEGDNLSLLIGHHGETLDALQYLLSVIVNRNQTEYMKVTLDTENYRAKREAALVRLAHQVADKARHTGKPVVMEPMAPYERRILHMTLQDETDVTTYSEGVDPHRHIVIAPKAAE